MKRKPVVWYVDDLSSNLRRFENNHSDHFDIKTFKDPSEVVAQLGVSTPDALLCDIFFYETEEIAESIETRINERASDLRAFAKAIDADKEAYQAGIPLIEDVYRKFDNQPPFPVYAYTSKGPYLLDTPGFDRIARLGATWLFKNRYGRDAERLLIQRGIEESQSSNSMIRRIRKHAPDSVVLAVFGAAIGVALDRLASTI